MAYTATKPDAGEDELQAAQSAKQEWRHRPAKEAQPTDRTVGVRRDEILDNVEWHYELRGERRGPVSAEDIHAMIKDKGLDAETLVWKKGLREWTRIEDTDLRDFINYDTPPPLPNDGGQHSVSVTSVGITGAIGTATSVIFMVFRVLMRIVRFVIGLAAQNIVR